MRTIPVNIKREPVKYDIRIERGLVTGAGLPEGYVITDTNLIKNYADLIKTDDLFVIDAGEQSKSPETYIKIVKQLPSDVKRIIAFGGGRVGDLAGFAASTYKRGTPLIQVPTSLLAMVDASIGGKNGVNLDDRKNYLGTIDQLQEILVDINLLKTLPENEFENGVAEIIKYGAIFDLPLLQRAERKISASDSDLEEIIEQCCKIKARVVEMDEIGRGGYRDTLGFGHTIGHAIEIPYGFSHGPAIAIGMVYALKVGEKSGIRCKDKIEQVKNALKANNLPTELPFGANIEKIIELMKADKDGPLIFVFGNQNWDSKVNEEIVREVLSS